MSATPEPEYDGMETEDDSVGRQGSVESRFASEDPFATPPPVPREKKTLTFFQTVHATAEFIECAIHTILYVRGVYPQRLFQRRRKFDAPVYQSRHPTLNNYIAKVVKALAEELLRTAVRKVVIIIKDKDDVALERYIFTVSTMQRMRGLMPFGEVIGGVYTSDVTQYFRTCLTRLAQFDTTLETLEAEGELSFSVVLELKPHLVPAQAEKSSDPPPWVPAILQHTTDGTADDAELHLIRGIETGSLNINLAVQESAERLFRVEERRRQAEEAAAEAALEALEAKTKRSAAMVPETTATGLAAGTMTMFDVP